jgi:hypothetical protein
LGVVNFFRSRGGHIVWPSRPEAAVIEDFLVFNTDDTVLFGMAIGLIIPMNETGDVIDISPIQAHHQTFSFMVSLYTLLESNKKQDQNTDGKGDDDHQTFNSSTDQFLIRWSSIFLSFCHILK